MRRNDSSRRTAPRAARPSRLAPSTTWAGRRRDDWRAPKARKHRPRR